MKKGRTGTCSVNCFPFVALLNIKKSLKIPQC